VGEYIPYYPPKNCQRFAFCQNSGMTMALTVAMSLVYLPVKWVRPIPAQFQQCSLQYLIASLEPSARQATIRQVSSTELANDIGSLPRVLTVAMEPCFNAVVGALNNVPTPMAEANVCKCPFDLVPLDLNIAE
jgi:hypothetical protein